MPDENSALLRTVCVYRWIMSAFGLVAPPLRHRILYLLYGVYVLGLMVMAFSMTYRISRFLAMELDTLIVNPLDSLTKWLSITLSVSLSSVQVIIQLSAVWHKRCSREFFADIATLERDLKALSTISGERVCSLKSDEGTADGGGGGADCGSGYHWRFLRSIGWWMLYLCTLFPPITYSLQAHLLPSIILVLTAWQHLIVEMKAVEYCVAVRLIHELLIEFNRDLTDLRRELVLFQRRQRQPQKLALPLQLPLRCYAWRLQAHQQLVARLWRLVSMLESYYCLDLIVLFVYNGLDIVDTTNWAFLNMLSGNYRLIYYRVTYMLTLLMCLFMPCWHAQSCINEYNRLGITLHTLRRSMAGCDELLADCLREYSLQLQHLPLRFTCAGYFDVTLQHFGSFFLTIMTYIIILIQFKLQV